MHIWKSPNFGSIVGNILLIDILDANHRTYRLYSSYPSSSLEIQQHVGASGIISRSTDFSRLHFAALSHHLIKCPWNAFMPGSETGSLP